MTLPFGIGAFCVTRLQALIKGRKQFGPFFQLPHPRVPTKAPRAFLVAIGPFFNSKVLGNPSAWRPVSIGPGGPKNSAVRRLGMGVIRMTGDQHAHYRHLLLPPLQRRSIDANGSKLISLAREFVGNWPIGQQIDLWASVRRLMRTFAIGVLFGDDRENGYPISDMIHACLDDNWSWKIARLPGANTGNTLLSHVTRFGGASNAALSLGRAASEAILTSVTSCPLSSTIQTKMAALLATNRSWAIRRPCSALLTRLAKMP